jgi:signal transduction histidine kinase/ActR/RegA family two-component response regulator
VTGVAQADLERRVLVHAPTPRDAELTRLVLERAGIACDCFADLDELCRALEAGAGAVLFPEEAVEQGRSGSLARYLANQAAWSDMPLLVLARHGAVSADVGQAMDLLGNVTVLERPIRVAALVSAVRSALRARQRQYQLRDHLAYKEQTEAALREADRRKDEFLAILAHELRNPLAPISNSLHLLRLTSQHDPTTRRVGEMMERQVDLMVRLVDDLLEVSRITRGAISLRREVVEVAAVVRRAVEANRALIEAAGHRLVLDIPSEPILVDADPVRLDQVIANLLSNAAKYTDPGGRIRLSVRCDGNEVAIAVRDTGMGIAPEKLGKVFDLFMQVEPHGQRAQGGLGIGLTLVKRLVELHGGRVEAHSEGTGRGSEFVIRLPIAVTATNAAEAKTTSEVRLFETRRVLVVDDNRDAAESLSMLLSMLGAETRVEHNGPDALAELAAFHPAIVILDIGMPAMDGLEVARRIREQHEFDDVVLVALTGWGQDDDRRRSRLAGFDHHLTKPAALADLKVLLANARRSDRGAISAA